jgi:sortase A
VDHSTSAATRAQVHPPRALTRTLYIKTPPRAVAGRATMSVFPPVLESSVVRRAIGALGRTSMTAGILLLLFVAYQLWGTGLYTARQQSRLRHEFNATLHRVKTHPRTTTPGASTPAPAPPSGPLPKEGDPVARIVVQKMALDAIVVEGVGVDDLRKGPGHYPSTPLPGQRGNSAIAGHRTTYGAPFGALDQLAAGDIITVVTIQGTFKYRVYQQLVVDPSDVLVLFPDSLRPATLTLTTCNPKYSAAQRLIVKAELMSPPLPPPPHLPKPRSLGLSGDSGSKLPTVISGIIAAAVGGLWWYVFHRRRRWQIWLAGSIPFAVALFFFYSYLERLLPANY